MCFACVLHGGWQCQDWDNKWQNSTLQLELVEDGFKSLYVCSDLCDFKFQPFRMTICLKTPRAILMKKWKWRTHACLRDINFNWHGTLL